MNITAKGNNHISYDMSHIVVDVDTTIKLFSYLVLLVFVIIRFGYRNKC